jgi:arsenical pump membrane protein
MIGPATLVWIIAALTIAGIIVRPWRVPEAVWAVIGAASLVILSLLSWRDALAAVAKGTDVYLFLIGMMLLAELARLEGLFDWAASHAVTLARGSATRLFAVVYTIGILVTIFLSNDATAVVLTPAVAAAARAARAPALPYLMACAFIANAASFVLPISNPANLVVFAHHMPPLAAWLSAFAAPSLLAVAATYLVLLWTQRRVLRTTIAADVAVPVLSVGGRVTAAAIAAMAVVLLTASALGWPLGLPTFLSGLAATLVVIACGKRAPLPVLRGIAWSVLPLVAGLFVLVEALGNTGVTEALADHLRHASAGEAGGLAGIVVALACNVANNLPVGLLAGSVVAAAHAPTSVAAAILIGVDLGPNLSVTGSLATILWLIALRRDGLHVGAWQFLRLGALVMPPALLLALCCLALLA